MRIYNKRPEQQTKSAFLKFVPPLYPPFLPPEPMKPAEVARLLLQDQTDETDKPALESKSGAQS